MLKSESENEKREREKVYLIANLCDLSNKDQKCQTVSDTSLSKSKAGSQRSAINNDKGK